MTQAEVPVTLSEGIARLPGVTEEGLDSQTRLMLRRGPSGLSGLPVGAGRGSGRRRDEQQETRED